MTSVESGRIMSLTHNIVLLLFFCVPNTWVQGQVYIDFNDFNATDDGVTLLDNDESNLTSTNNLSGPEKVRIQLYYECLCPYCKYFNNELAPIIETMSADLDIQTYPFGNAEIIEDNGKLEFECQHGPAECYGNKLHACALYKLQHTTALLYNICLMNSTEGKGSDDKSADRCGKLMKIDSETIKECAKSTRGNELLRYYGERSNVSHVPYVLINGEGFRGDGFKNSVCNAFTNLPPSCE